MPRRKKLIPGTKELTVEKRNDEQIKRQLQCIMIKRSSFIEVKNMHSGIKRGLESDLAI